MSDPIKEYEQAFIRASVKMANLERLELSNREFIKGVYEIEAEFPNVKNDDGWNYQVIRATGFQLLKHS